MADDSYSMFNPSPDSKARLDARDNAKREAAASGIPDPENPYDPEKDIEKDPDVDFDTDSGPDAPKTYVFVVMREYLPTHPKEENRAVNVCRELGMAQAHIRAYMTMVPNREPLWKAEWLNGMNGGSELEKLTVLDEKGEVREELWIEKVEMWEEKEMSKAEKAHVERCKAVGFTGTMF